jgi:hypothetical protein
MLDPLPRQSREVKEHDGIYPSLTGGQHQFIQLRPLLRHTADHILVLTDQFQVVTSLDKPLQLMSL